MTKRLISMRTHILLVVLGVILAVFVIITLAFNILMNNYIGSTARDQLSSVIVVQRGAVSVSGSVEIPDLSKASPGRFNTRPDVFRMDSSYTAYTPDNALPQEAQAAQAIADQLKARRVDPGEMDVTRVVTGSGAYYVDSVGMTGSDFMMFYVDVTGIVNFAGGVNLFFLFTMAAAVLITFMATFVIARHMTRPLAHLTAFSERIGRGDFTPCSEEFHDRELMTLADSMNRAAGQLESYDKDQKVFFQNASHELRTPLMSIKCYAEGIEYGIMDAKKASGTILSETDRLSEMVEDLLTVSRIDNITKEQMTVACDLRELLAAAADEQRSIAEKKNIQFAFDFDEAPVMTQANDKTLYRAFSNLISNALRYAKSEIVLTCGKSGNRIIAAVADDGGGIDPLDMPHIFERFYKGKDGNHGIGLSIVKSVVEQLDGKIEVQSGPSGTSFTIVFPSQGKDGGAK